LDATGIILAAGKGTRMVSDLPKALHKVCGIPLTEHCVRAMRGAGLERVVVVIGHGADQVREALGECCAYAMQAEQLGTGHAVTQALPLVETADAIVMPGDAPLMRSESLKSLYAHHKETGADLTLAVVQYNDPTGYGRVFRDEEGMPVAIVEEKDCTAEQRAIHEVCVSLYCFSTALLRQLLPQVTSANAQGEFYLTDIVRLAAGGGKKVVTWNAADPLELMGVNDRWQLAEAGKELRLRKVKELCLSGVTFVDPDTCFLEADVKIGRDTLVEPNCYLLGNTSIGSGCVIGPGTRLANVKIADRTTVLMSNLMESEVGTGTRIGPFSHLRPGSKVGDRCSIGDYVEIKKSVIADDVSIGHLAYIGDASVGEGTNIGAGTITCNYDGKRKHRTVIGRNVFIGSNNTLVAPVEIGDGAFTAAGSTITQDVEPNALAVGRSRQTSKEGWAEHWRNRP